MLDVVAIAALSLSLRSGRALHPRLRPAEGRPSMILNVILLVLSALLMIYLVYALLRPEKF